MNKKYYYKKLRTMGYEAKWAWHDAGTLETWDILGNQGLVRLWQEPEQENYWDVYGKSDSLKEKWLIEDLIERWGCWYIFGEYKCQCCGSWNHGDGVGMIIQLNPLSLENPYLVDIMAGTLNGFKEKSAFTA